MIYWLHELVNLPPNPRRYVTQRSCEKLAVWSHTGQPTSMHCSQSEVCASQCGSSSLCEFPHLGRCSRETLRHWLVLFEIKNRRFKIRGEETGSKMMATLSLTGAVASWQLTVGMRRSRAVGCRKSLLFFLWSECWIQLLTIWLCGTFFFFFSECRLRGNGAWLISEIHLQFSLKVSRLEITLIWNFFYPIYCLSLKAHKHFA